VVCEVVRSPRPSNKPEKEKVNGQESEEGFEEGSEEIDGEVIAWGKEFSEALRSCRGAFFL
jgi:hypothetical protein